MATANTAPDLPMVAAADYSSTGQFRFVKLNTSNSRATLCSTAGEYAFGVLQDDPAAAGDPCAVRVFGTSKVYAGDTVTAGDQVTTDANGAAVTATKNSENVAGVALESATVGQVFEILVRPALAGGDVVRRKGTIELPLALARELSSNDTINLAGVGGLLASDSTPILDVITAGSDQQMEVTWASSNSDKIAWHVGLPEDLDDSADVTLHCQALMSGSTDTPTATWEAFFNVGDTDAGGATSALSSTQAELSVTVAAANVAAHPGMLALTLAPGAHTTDAVILRRAWVEYTRK